MFSTKLYVNTEKNNTLTLRITNNRKKSELTLGIKLTPEQFENAMSSHPKPQNARYRSLLLSLLSKIEEVKCELIESGRAGADAKAIKEILKKNLLGEPESEPENVEGAFLSHFRKFADYHQNRRTRQIYDATLSRLSAYDSRLASRTFEDITVDWLSGFDLFLSRTSPSKNARNIHFRNIRAVMKDAFKADLTAAHPFDRFRHTGEPTRKRALPVETLRRIFNAEVEPWQQKYLDFFKLTFMLIGINSVDLCSLTEICDGRVEYVRAKTHKTYSIKVEPEAMEILERYSGGRHLLNYVDNYKYYRSFYNNLCIGLRAIRSELRLKELTTYSARHSWATIARAIGVPKDIISLAMGHGSRSVTDIYIDYDMAEADRANRRVLDWVLYGKR